MNYPLRCHFVPLKADIYLDKNKSALAGGPLVL